MPVLPFDAARQRHATLHEAAARNEPLARAAYAGVTGLGTESAISRAVADTTPREYAALLMLDDVAATVAAVVQVRAFEAAGGEPDSPGAARKVAHEGWKAFRDLAERGAEYARGTGADMSDAWPILVRAERKGVNPEKIREIANMAGRMLVALRGALQKRAVPLPEETIGVELGEDVTALVPEEYALLGIPTTEADVLRRLVERRAVQFERRGREKKERGPLIILLDESDSMMESDHRNTWAKAAAVALTRLAWEGKRPVAWISFSSMTRITLLPPGSHAELLVAANRFLSGGTHIPRALHAGLAALRELEQRGFRGADFVLISDGVTDGARELPGALDALDRTGTRLWAIAIDVDWRKSKGLRYDSSPLAERAAKYVHLSSADMRSPTGAVKVAGAVGG
jgi:Mg-chelatase subunit ChlD